MKVVVAGGSGFVGRYLIPHLAAEGHEVVLLSRSAEARVAGARTVVWHPGEPGSWSDELRAAAAVVNLCGESLGAGRWTERRKRVLRDSRLVPTASLVDAMAALPAPERPAVLLSPSGADVYEGRDAVPATEDTPPADSYLSRLCRDWEAEAARAEEAGVRVVCMRLSPIVAQGAVSLARMVLPFRLMAGGPLGSGEQWHSWVAIDDVLGVVSWAISEDRVRGPLNVTAPEPVRQREFAAALGRALGRPSWLRTPAWAIRTVLGEQSVLALGSRRVVPAKALALGYDFMVTAIDDALRSALTHQGAHE